MSFMANIEGNKALNAQKKGNFQEALEIYRSAYKKGMDKPVLLHTYSTLLVRLGQVDEALEIIKKIDRIPGLPAQEQAENLVNYTVVLWKKGHLDHAVELLEKQLSIKKTGQLYAVLGYLLIEQGNVERALAVNEEALEYDDEDSIFLDNMGQLYYRLLHDPEKALPYFD